MWLSKARDLFTMITGLADTFADYSDLTGYIHARDVLGMSVHAALSKGDNGVGKWGEITAQLHTAMVALSPEDFEQFGATAKGKMVRVYCGDKIVLAQLQDERPLKANVNPGTVIELNPATCLALGVVPPATVQVAWEWV